MIDKKEKLKTLGAMYIIPVISMIIFALTKNIEVNGEPVHLIVLAMGGFVVGMAVEGALFIIGVTVAVLFNKA